jgi:hypothetical protein
MKEYDCSVSLSRRFNAAFRCQSRWARNEKGDEGRVCLTALKRPLELIFRSPVDPLSIDEPLRV